MTKATKRVIIVAVAFVVMAAIVLGMVAALINGGTGGNKVTENGGMIMGESYGNGVALTSSVIDPEDYAAYGVSALAESAYTVTATITPSNAYTQGVSWSLEFVNPVSEWASGEDVSDYVTIASSGENNHIAIVSCLMAFGEQIKLTAISEDDENITAECLLDYSARFRNLAGMITCTRTISGTIKASASYKFGMDTTIIDVSSGGRNQSYSNSFKGSHSFSTGTIIEEVTESYKLKLSEGLITAMQSEGLSVAFETRDIESYTNLMFDGVFFSSYLSISSSSEDWSKLVNAINNNSDDYDFAIVYICATTHEELSSSAKVKINTASMASVTSISLDNSSIVF